MRSLNLIIIILFISSYPLTSAYAFFDKDIHLLTMQDGRVDNTVTCIYKDEDGFMWFGTNNGLSRYDGKAIKNFSPLETSIPVEEIVKLSGDYLGIVAGSRLYCFNRKQECFIPAVLEQKTEGVSAYPEINCSCINGKNMRFSRSIRVRFI